MRRPFSAGAFFTVILVLTLAAIQGFAKDDLNPEEIIAADPEAGRLLEVPFLPQNQYECGPASLAMVLGYHHLQADPDRIASRFQTKAVAGTFTIDLLIAATDHGVEAHWVTGTIEALRAEISHHRPVIVFLNLAMNPLPRRHFAVAIGHLIYKGKNYVVLHSGITSRLMVPERKFMRQWKRTGYMMMTVSPKEKKQGSGRDGPAKDDQAKNPGVEKR